MIRASLLVAIFAYSHQSLDTPLAFIVDIVIIVGITVCILQSVDVWNIHRAVNDHRFKHGVSWLSGELDGIGYLEFVELLLLYHLSLYTIYSGKRKERAF